MAFEEFKNPDIKTALESAPNQEAQINIARQFKDKYSGYREGSSFIIKDKNSGAELEIPAPKYKTGEDYYSPTAIEKRQKRYEGNQVDLMPNVQQLKNAVPEVVKEHPAATAGLVTALATGGSSLPLHLMRLLGYTGAGSAIDDVITSKNPQQKFRQEAVPVVASVLGAEYGGPFTKYIPFIKDIPGIANVGRVAGAGFGAGAGTAIAGGDDGKPADPNDILRHSIAASMTEAGVGGPKGLDKTEKAITQYVMKKYVDNVHPVLRQKVKALIDKLSSNPIRQAATGVLFNNSGEK